MGRGWVGIYEFVRNMKELVNETNKPIWPFHRNVRNKKHYLYLYKGQVMIQYPVCKKEMKKMKCYDVIVDICSKHGIWLDKGELTSIRKGIVSRRDTSSQKKG